MKKKPPLKIIDLPNRLAIGFLLFALSCFFLLALPETLDSLIFHLAWTAAAGTFILFLYLHKYHLPRLQHMALMSQMYTALFLLILLIFAQISELFVHIRLEGLEEILILHPYAGWLIFLAVCFFQPIALPFPEAVTVLAGSIAFGPFIAFILAFSGTVCGMLVMFLLVRFGRNNLLGNEKNQTLLDKFDRLAENYGTLIIALLCIIPILPDEIICIGAGISQLPFLTFVAIILFTKLITSFALAYSVFLADVLDLSEWELLGAEVILILFGMGITLLWNRSKKRIRLSENELKDELE